MPSIPRTMLAVGVVLLVGGSAAGGWGVYQQVTDPCESGYGVTITKIGSTDSADPAAEHVDYRNLSRTEQRLFTEILTAETTPIYQNTTHLDGLSQKVITYQGERYETSPVFVADCAYGWAFFKIWGAFVALLGGAIVLVTAGWGMLR